ncbi:MULTISPECIES: sulfotransferase domain-containing protein [unclassified Coleofasciculus]|uniref:sulfotransferase domain-containing protein n=1 Tax=unclassified Coleofasciculus TaxID=2692782 RepID=UPI0018810762|nr:MULTISPECIES: sulfotransferase domain-containing protein [unclassified Coleofasciculus]MBE9127549.1 sulfotransferase domain-containing protein [Coleofasciculus sp. LEGE 07081]MBE9147207.1 sulfotransferase domain-containing protein [Coleofasciculus sp. LEGE 07092]
MKGKLHLPEELPKIRQGQYIATHLYWSQELVDALKSANIRNLFIIRDLRDVAVSRAYYHTYSLSSHPAFTYLNSLKSDADRLMVAIRGINKPGMGFCSIGDWARGYAPWWDEPTCLTIRFEDLIGRFGGGSDEKQVQAVRAIASYLGMEVSENQINEIASKAFFKNANTFRKGQIGDWKNHFSEEHKRAFKEVAGEAIIKYGYADGYD